MNPTVVHYEKLSNLGNYEHEKVGVTIALEPGDTAAAAIARAKVFVEGQLAVSKGEFERIGKEEAECYRDEIASPSSEMNTAHAMASLATYETAKTKAEQLANSL